jgi:hypothetical protein
VAVQRNFTRFPLEYRYVDADLVGAVGVKDDEALKTRFLKSLDENPFGNKNMRKDDWLISNRRERNKYGLERNLDQEDSSKNEMSLFVGKPDTGYSIEYFFRRERDCWYLFRVYNNAI